VRQSLNDNPVFQVVLIGILAVVVGFLLLTRVMGGGTSSDTASTDAATTTPAPADTSASGADAAAAPTAPADAAGTAGTTPDVAGSTPDAAAVPDASGAAPAVPASGFEAGPGLPEGVVDAYGRGDTVVLLVSKKRGIEDQTLRASAAKLRSRPNTAVFTTNTLNVSKYSRITSGVDLDRAPALVVLSPKRLSKGDLPTASVAYGYRSPQSTVQAVEDAEYDGKQLPYYPK
jgi:hypothetical protein